jgi:hypothetical protein
VKLWLDDVRPAPEGWTHAKTAHEAFLILRNGDVDEASFDHDLGICSRCTPGHVAAEANLVVVASLDAVCAKDCTCECHYTGSDLVRWMAQDGVWSRRKPRVHSANPVGAAYMRGVIDRYWTGED